MWSEKERIQTNGNKTNGHQAKGNQANGNQTKDSFTCICPKCSAIAKESRQNEKGNPAYERTSSNITRENAYQDGKDPRAYSWVTGGCES